MIMAFKLTSLAVAIALLDNANANPVASLQTIRAETSTLVQAAAEKYLALSWALAPLTGCAGQSCAAADTAGSTGQLPKYKVEGGSATSWKCIEKWNPEGAAAGQKSPPIQKQSTGVSSSLLGGLNGVTEGISYPETKGTFNSKCTKNIVLFAKGTMEPGALGMLVGPSISSALKGDWSVVGIPYTADIGKASIFAHITLGLMVIA
jgi:hypothetical protein